MSRTLRARVSVACIPALAAAIALGAPMVLVAQTTTAILRGHVRFNGKGVPGATVTAVNKGNGYTNSAVVKADGTFHLTLEPATYILTASAKGYGSAIKSAQVQVGQALDLDFKLTQANEASAVVEVSGTLTELRSAEVATNISLEQIESLPQGNRNFLNYAALAPGIKLSNDELNQSFSSGGQTNQHVNIFIDGASYKSDVLSGGTVGQDSSRGNPFPLGAVQEFRVMTENYKAEYQKASGAVISAVTKSGTNEFHGDVFFSYQDKSLVANNYFAEKRGQPKPDYTRAQEGFSIGGPILKDKMHFYFSFEGNEQKRDNSVFLGGGNTSGASAALVTELKSYQGQFDSPFNSKLLFGKVDYQVNATHMLEWTVNYRGEHEKRDFGYQTSYENATDLSNSVITSNLKDKITNANWVNEAMLTVQRSEWNPKPVNPDLVAKNYFGIMEIGGHTDQQDFVQKRTSLRDDFTYLGVTGHTIKAGASIDFMNYEIKKWQLGNPVFNFDPNLDPTLTVPFQAQYGTGNPDLSANNREIGWYVQDDWNATPKLLINAGLRWDYESDMFNDNYVSPASASAVVNFLGISRDYISTGSERKPYYGAFQPRVGFSYDVHGNSSLVVFGGVGRYFDRESFNNVLDERYRLQYGVRNFYFSTDGKPVQGNPSVIWDPSYMSKEGLNGLIASGVSGNPQLFLLNNKSKPAYSDQATLGARGKVGIWNASVTFTDVRSFNSLTWRWGNRDSLLNPINVNSYGFSDVLISDTKKTWYDAMYVTFEKPYTEASGWGFGVHYTLSSAKQTGNDLFSLDFINADAYGKHPTADDERNRVVMDGIVKLPYGFRLSGLITLSTGLPFTIYDTTGGWGYNQRHFYYNAGRPIKYSFIIPNAWGYRSVDLKLQKDFMIGKGKLGVNVEALNLFNYTNFLYSFDSGHIEPTPASAANFGKPTDAMVGRRIQFGATYQF